jgi:hypothetical protein
MINILLCFQVLLKKVMNETEDIVPLMRVVHHIADTDCVHLLRTYFTFMSDIVNATVGECIHVMYESVSNFMIKALNY